MTNQKRKGKRSKGGGGVLSLLFIPHNGKLRTLKITRWKPLFRLTATAMVILLVTGTSLTVRTFRENASLKAVLEETRVLHQQDVTSLNTLAADQAAMLSEMRLALDQYTQGATRKDSTFDNFRMEYENMLVAYIDKNIGSTQVSRGSNGNDSFRADVTALKGLLETARVASLDETDSLSRLNEKITRLDAYVQSLPSFWPTVQGAEISSDFGRRFHPVYHRYKKHEGIDIGERRGDPIYAAGSGTVTRAEWASGYGRLVEIDHGNGYVTRYAHCSKLLVTEGQKVTQGESIAQMGSSGTATGPHLHFEVRIHGTPVDPTPFITD